MASLDHLTKLSFRWKLASEVATMLHGMVSINAGKHHTNGLIHPGASFFEFCPCIFSSGVVNKLQQPAARVLAGHGSFEKLDRFITFCSCLPSEDIKKLLRPRGVPAGHEIFEKLEGPGVSAWQIERGEMVVCSFH
eukprot:1157918-Pelagomonas_calceolata.AAC.2